jgi:hypothetical protein
MVETPPAGLLSLCEAAVGGLRQTLPALLHQTQQDPAARARAAALLGELRALVESAELPEAAEEEDGGGSINKRGRAALLQ